MGKNEIIKELKRAFDVACMSDDEILEKYYSDCKFSKDNFNRYPFLTGYLQTTIEYILSEEKQ